MRQLWRGVGNLAILGVLVGTLSTLAIKAEKSPMRLPVESDVPGIYNSERDQNAQPMPASQAAKAFTRADDFDVQVVAHEPDVQNPIDMAWDAKGRLWIAENYTYAERTLRFDLSLHDRVVVFTDTDGDGLHDERVLFTDDVQKLTSVEVGRGGVWLMTPPRLLFIPDADGNLKPDGPPQVMLDGFEVAKENHHNFANGLRFGPDGWLYGRCGGSCPGRIGRPGTPAAQRVALEGGIWRYHPTAHTFEVLAHGTTNPWGHDWDEFGEMFFINTVNGHLWHMIPGAHFHRPFTLDPNPHVYELLDMHADHWHFDTGSAWHQQRDGKANEYGGGHAHCGMMIYQGDQWPDEYRGRLMTWNLHGQRVNQELLERVGSGYVGRHGKDMLIAGDPFFRGMELSTGPDGSVYAIDWSDTGECHEHTGVHRTSGRIYRIAAKGRPGTTGSDFDLTKLSAVELVDRLAHDNIWHVRQARLLLTQKAVDGGDIDEVTVRLLRLLDDENPILVYRALTTLHAMGLTNTGLLKEHLAHPNEHIRVWAIRCLTDSWPIDDVFGVHPAVNFQLFGKPNDGTIMGPTTTKMEQTRISLAAEALLPGFLRMAAEDESALVRLALASTLQRLPLRYRLPLADRLMQHSGDADDHNLPLMVWYGLMPTAELPQAGGITRPSGSYELDGGRLRSPDEDLAKLATTSKWPKLRIFIARRIALDIDRNPQGLDKILADLIERRTDGKLRRQVLTGLAQGLKGRRRVTRPTRWNDFVAAIEGNADPETQAIVRELSILFGDGRALDEVKRIVQDANAEINLRRTALETLVQSDDESIVAICLPLLSDARLNTVAAKGVSRGQDPKIARALIKNYRRFRAPTRPQVISILVSRLAFARELMTAIEQKKIPSGDLTAFDVRQMRALGSDELMEQVSTLWGDIRESSAAKREQIETLRKNLTPETLAAADRKVGRELFSKTCAKCHRLYGEGETIGPDLTGANRSNLDYLLENIIDPSAVVSKNYRMSIVLLTDGRVLSGLVTNKTDRTLTLQTQTEKLTIATDDIEELRLTTKSPMPEGLLDNLNDDQVRALFGYLGG